MKKTRVTQISRELGSQIEGLELRDVRRVKNDGNGHRASLSEDGSSKMSKQSPSPQTTNPLPLIHPPHPHPTVLNGTPGGRLRFLAFTFLPTPDLFAPPLELSPLPSPSPVGTGRKPRGPRRP